MRAPQLTGWALGMALLGAPAVVLADDEAKVAQAEEEGGGVPGGGLGGYRSEWRRRARAEESQLPEWLEPTHFAFELRFGPYFSQVDDEFGGSGPYEQVFGTSPLFHFGLELDWLPIRIPYVGSLGPAFGWGYSHASAKAKISGTTEDSGADTGLTIMPMHASLSLRFDGPLHEWTVPVVPYVKVGFGWGVWTASNAEGTAQAGGVEGKGLSLGPHFALGAAIALNGFDDASAHALQDQVGIGYVYLFGEWMLAALGTVGSDTQMQIGTSTGMFGLALDF